MSSSSSSQSLPPQYLEAYIGHEVVAVAVAVMFIVLDVICVTLVESLGPPPQQSTLRSGWLSYGAFVDILCSCLRIFHK